ncbi:postsynaptic density protein [Capsaspora owczarzaki ATCC 30864]|uniref:Postsynaptic density protein n=2 Tax=Capsaspora owczarzaki TaxID=192875 RepID=A0A0D2WJY8_CAPO3|nr:postsynaptic density protein [Capsaspora owczarzaki ATCC 30864]ADF49634.1 DLG [Capsaspora owczarzaki]KJE89808.1 postsynaptic density protein [Capsaspora owczarzaki ATCC 30864]|eukprot:XP_004349749.1 postsynaptic density protein [Capsaspora owczarzaki ATCC 30864]
MPTAAESNTAQTKQLQQVVAALKDKADPASLNALKDILGVSSSTLFHRINDAGDNLTKATKPSSDTTPADSAASTPAASPAPSKQATTAAAPASPAPKQSAAAVAAVAAAPVVDKTPASPAPAPAAAAPAAAAAVASPTPSAAGAAAAEPTREIVLVKGSTGLGFNIVGGSEQRANIYVSKILSGGVADRDGRLRRGDEILKVNDTVVLSMSHEGAASVLKQSSGEVRLSVRFNPTFEKYLQTLDENASKKLSVGTLAAAAPGAAAAASEQSNTAPSTPAKTSISSAGAAASPLVTSGGPKSFHVRALFEFIPDPKECPGKALSFKPGDILFVSNANDDEWWEARMEADQAQVGLIPSRARHERRERGKSKNVKFDGPLSSTLTPAEEAEIAAKFHGKDKDGRGSMRMVKKLSIFGKKSRGEDSPAASRSGSTDATKDNSKFPAVPTYEIVTLDSSTTDFKRPLVILGPVKDLIYERLLQEEPDLYAPCVPHTTRPPRPDEENGREYFFVTREQMEKDMKEEKFMEAGQFKQNLYGTSIDAVRTVIQQKKHCIVDVSASAVETLRANKLKPVVIFLKVTSADSIIKLNPSMPVETATKVFDTAQKLEATSRQHFTDVVKADVLDEAVAAVRQAVTKSSATKTWVAANRPLP